ncbi:hypothetical protein BS50DRAFT_416261 [Corynespora cassiicola Philippines]|uniref:Uncharacterized protein n=1 Tax=Corynespora cassiicola Philippines TaxID=1448308 RepID=A0A2T2NN72_CORCC|nr:hypothetical protein BS50DRAFT_416261 [Corynespora cassiicola Philippines]
MSSPERNNLQPSTFNFADLAPNEHYRIHTKNHMANQPHRPQSSERYLYTPNILPASLPFFLPPSDPATWALHRHSPTLTALALHRLGWNRLDSIQTSNLASSPLTQNCLFHPLQCPSHSPISHKPPSTPNRPWIVPSPVAQNQALFPEGETRWKLNERGRGTHITAHSPTLSKKKKAPATHRARKKEGKKTRTTRSTYAQDASRSL